MKKRLRESRRGWSFESWTDSFEISMSCESRKGSLKCENSRAKEVETKFRLVGKK